MCEKWKRKKKNSKFPPKKKQSNVSHHCYQLNSRSTLLMLLIVKRALKWKYEKKKRESWTVMLWCSAASIETLFFWCLFYSKLLFIYFVKILCKGWKTSFFSFSKPQHWSGLVRRVKKTTAEIISFLRFVLKAFIRVWAELFWPEKDRFSEYSGPDWLFFTH